LTEERGEDLDWNGSHVCGCTWFLGTYCYTVGDFSWSFRRSLSLLARNLRFGDDL
jgi:hypothetical protein